MSDLKTYWNDSSATIPDDKDPSNYAVEVSRSFPDTAVICDLGGGGGTDSLYFAGRGYMVKLLDISDHALLRARHAAERQGRSSALETYQCDLGEGKIPLESESCDVVYSRLALHYFKSDLLSTLFAEVYRVLKPGGRTFLTLKSPDDPAEMEYLRGNAKETEDGVFDEGGFIKTRFSTAQLTAMLSEAGIPDDAYAVNSYTEKVDGRNDRVKSGNSQFVVNEIRIEKK